jgi:Co-chaperonin GroES (HSP10)
MSDKFDLQPLSDRLIIKPIEYEEKTKGGLFIPDVAKERPQQGMVVAAGPGRLNDEGKEIPMRVKVGDKVLYGKYTGTQITYDDVEYIIMKETEILAIINR